MSKHWFDDDYEGNKDEEYRMPLSLTTRKNRRERELMAYPDCRDPNHPGCEYCDEDHPNYKGNEDE